MLIDLKCKECETIFEGDNKVKNVCPLCSSESIERLWTVTPVIWKCSGAHGRK